MLTLNDILWGIGAPILAAALLVVLAHLPRRRRRRRGAGTTRDAQPWGAAAGVAVGFTAAFVTIVGRPAVPPVAAEGWLPYLALAAVVVAVVATVLGRGRARLAAWVLSGLLLALTAWLLARPQRQALEPAQFWTLAAVPAAGMIAWWLAMETLARRVPGPTVPLLLSAFAGAAALVLVDSGTQTLGQIAGAAAVALGTIGLLALWLRDLTLSGGAILTVAVTVLGLIVCGETHFYGYIATPHASLLAAAPLAMWAGQLVPARRPRTRFAVRAAAVLLLLSLPLVVAVKGLHKTMTEQTESYQY